jgi:hypothetical protein
MRNLYLVLEKINNYLSNHQLISSVTFGDIFDVDLKKQSIFPLAHVIVNDATFQGSSLNTVSFSLSILVMDVVDESKGDIQNEADPFYGIDNTQDVLNSTLVVLNGLAQELVKGQLNTDLYQIQDSSSLTCTPFLDRFENKLAGWNMTVDIQTANTEISVC